MFDRLATSLCIAFKWLPMLNLDQTFSSTMLLHEQQTMQAQAGKINKPIYPFNNRVDY